MKRTILIFGLLFLLGGCAEYQLVSYNTDSNFLVFNHPYTDKAQAEVLARAEKLCAQRKQVVIETTKICSPTKCTTNYQCVPQSDIGKYGL